MSRHLVWIAALAIGCTRPAPPPRVAVPWSDGYEETNRYLIDGGGEVELRLAVSDTQIRLDETSGRHVTAVADGSTGLPNWAEVTLRVGAETVTRSLRRTAPGSYLLRWDSTTAASKIEYPPEALVVMADALPIWLRTLPQVATHRRTPIRVELLPTLATPRAEAGNWRRIQAAIQIHAPEDLVVPAGMFRAWRYTVNLAGGGEEVWWIEDGGTRRILRLLATDGTQWRLRDATPSLHEIEKPRQ